MVADHDIVDVESREVGNIVSELYEEEEVFQVPGGTIEDEESMYVLASVTCGEAVGMEVHILEMDHIKGMFTNEAEYYRVRD